MVLTGLTIQLSESSNCNFDIIVNRTSVLYSSVINNITSVNINSLNYLLDVNSLISVRCTGNHA